MEQTLSITQQPIPVDHVWTGAQIQELLETHIRFRDWKFVVQQSDIQRGGMWDIDLHLRIEWMAPDNVTGALEKQSSRWWRLSKHMRKNEIINTAFLAVRVAMEHELREEFLYLHDGKWTMPYNTHTDVDELAAASVVVDVRVDNRPEAPKNQRRD